MSTLFTIFIMWVLYQNSLCSKNLALTYTIIAIVCIAITAISKTIKEIKAERKAQEAEIRKAIEKY